MPLCGYAAVFFFINLQTPPFKRNPGHVTGVAFLASVGDFEAARIGRRASVRVCSGGRGPYTENFFY